MKNSSLKFIFNLLLFVFVFIPRLVVSANSQSDPCTNRINFNDLVNFDTTSLSCQSVWKEEDYILRYKKVNSKTWSFLLSAPDKGGYVAIGFSQTGRMDGSSAMVGWRENGWTGMIKPYYLGDKSVANVKVDQGDLKVVKNSSTLFVQSSRFYLAFELTTSQPSNRLLFAVGPSGFQPRSPKYQLQYHSNMIATNLNYASGQVQTQESPYASLRNGHGVINILAWGIFVPVGTLTARYFRRYDPIWFYSHVAIQTFGFILGLIGIILGMVLEGLLNSGDSVARHKSIGVTILILGCLQVSALILRPKKGSSVRKYWNWYHHFSGRLVVLLSIINVFYGISVAEGGITWSLSYGLILAIMVIASIYGEIKLRRED